MHYHWDLAMVLADTDLWWRGIGVTLLYSVATVAGGIVIGVFCGLTLLSQKRWRDEYPRKRAVLSERRASGCRSSPHPPRCARHPLPQCGRGATDAQRAGWVRVCTENPR